MYFHEVKSNAHPPIVGAQGNSTECIENQCNEISMLCFAGRESVGWSRIFIDKKYRKRQSTWLYQSSWNSMTTFFYEKIIFDFMTTFFSEKFILTNRFCVNDPPILAQKQPKVAIFDKTDFWGLKILVKYPPEERVEHKTWSTIYGTPVPAILNHKKSTESAGGAREDQNTLHYRAHYYDPYVPPFSSVRHHG